MQKDEFCARFIAYMVKHAGFERFDDGPTVAEYAEDTAPNYFDDDDLRGEGPEECAASDMQYWGEE